MFLILLIAAALAAAAYYHFQQSQKAGSGSSKRNDVPSSCVSTANQPGTVTCAAGSVLPQSVTAVAKSTDSDVPQKPSLTESTVNRIDALPATTPTPVPSDAPVSTNTAKPSDSAASPSTGSATPSSGATSSKGGKKKKRSRKGRKNTK
ncbi:hypothetical protein PRIPAC_90188 [Pristionchus pacificus]|uniref:Uncharacterized protein n=1 Tax=Pristionchus pacificus TaxID=54126 RepID=A0A454Y753_PRIPA|nr:hypothetical protein PRIPAC_90188 [Pristionchus pacificus]|eukprot:PDM62086.1 hypothetical protein PRIPAC_51528 [Pristionchus pacificus]